MEESAEPKAVPISPKEPPFIYKVLKVAAYPIAAVAGALVSHYELHHAVFEKHKKIKHGIAFKDIKEHFSAQFEENTEDLLRGVKKIGSQAFIIEDGKPATSTKTHIVRDRAIRKEHGAAIGERMKEMGFGTREDYFNFEALFNKWHGVNKDIKRKIVFEGIAVTGVALGVLLTMVDNKWLSSRLAGEKEVDDKGR
jgi:hypothetical protein